MASSLLYRCPTDVGKTDLSFIENLQGLAMQTSVLQQPFVIISPRFLNMGSSGGLDHGIELSSTFGVFAFPHSSLKVQNRRVARPGSSVIFGPPYTPG
mmetsp:Transcript_32167/g.74018  ORF Transcript_32167/g.74018 Transcript_32167/m.74018 type:complete len:98 (-) Transcript_32167:519-812(-)